MSGDEKKYLTEAKFPALSQSFMSVTVYVSDFGCLCASAHFSVSSRGFLNRGGYTL